MITMITMITVMIAMITVIITMKLEPFKPFTPIPSLKSLFSLFLQIVCLWHLPCNFIIDLGCKERPLLFIPKIYYAVQSRLIAIMII